MLTPGLGDIQMVGRRSGAAEPPQFRRSIFGRVRHRWVTPIPTPQWHATLRSQRQAAGRSCSANDAAARARSRRANRPDRRTFDVITDRECGRLSWVSLEYLKMPVNGAMVVDTMFLV